MGIVIGTEAMEVEIHDGYVVNPISAADFNDVIPSGGLVRFTQRPESMAIKLDILDIQDVWEDMGIAILHDRLEFLLFTSFANSSTSFFNCFFSQPS